ncbi:MAG: ABC transporter substrate-binding protein [Motiliproteus sp.]|nr:ABC transporter substrate-binding protein [Motiliproteus sp.]MCW9052736.1 ABC transporter substrate-binding protein [Motiliproteus sp.]
MTKQLLTLLFIFGFSVTSIAEEVDVFVHGTSTAAYKSSSGELRGKHHLGRQALLVEIVRELMISSDQAPVMEELELKQGLKQLQQSGAAALVDIGKAEPLAELRRVGPLQSDSILFFARKDKLGTFKTLDDTKQARICSRGSTKHGDRLRAQGFDKVVEVSTYKVCWDQLINGEADLTTLGENLIPTITYVARDIADQIDNTGIYLHRYDSYLAFSKGTADKTVKEWSSTLEKLKASDDYESLIHHFYCQQDCF